MSNRWKMVVLVLLAAAIVTVAGRNTEKTSRSPGRASSSAEKPNCCPGWHPEKAAPAAVHKDGTGATPAAPNKECVSRPDSAQVAAEAPAAAKPRVGKATVAKPERSAATALPKLVDVGATKCLACKLMATVLDELKREKKGKLEVVFIDVSENPEAESDYKIKMIPTQILYDREGKEVFRHEGFFPKKDVLAKFSEHGIEL